MGPWLKFYPADWRADPALRMCSMAARGLWMEMLCIMHEAVPRGSLLVNGRSVSDRQLAALAGLRPGETAALLAEMESAGVFSRDDDGTIYSRRMRRDEEKNARDKANGRAGGNPRLKGGVNPPDNPSGDGGIKPRSQKPEARSQKPENQKPAAGRREREVAEPDADAARLRGLLGTEPVVLDPDPSPVLGLLGRGCTWADIEAGIAAAMAEPHFRPRYWRQLVGWIERAAKDRLAGVPKRLPAANTNPAPDPELVRRGWMVLARAYFRGEWQASWTIEGKRPKPGEPGFPADIAAQAAAEAGVPWPPVASEAA